MVQGPGWQHHPARPACLASPLRCRRHGSRARRSPQYCRGPRSRPAYSSARYSALIDGRTRKARESTLPRTIALALPAPTSRTIELATKRAPDSLEGLLRVSAFAQNHSSTRAGADERVQRKGCVGARGRPRSLPPQLASALAEALRTRYVRLEAATSAGTLAARLVRDRGRLDERGTRLAALDVGLQSRPFPEQSP